MSYKNINRWCNEMIECGDSDLAFYLFEKFEPEINFNEALYSFIEIGDRNGVDFCLSKGANINREGYYNPLCHAIRANLSFEFICFLTEKGAKSNAMTVACAIYNENSRIIEKSISVYEGDLILAVTAYLSEYEDISLACEFIIKYILKDA